MEITEPDAFISFHIELNLNKGEEFLILINSNITNYYTYNNNSDQKNYFLNISLNKGENLIQFIFTKKLIFVLAYKNPVLIKNITIQG
jgi:hypothetical protein